MRKFLTLIPGLFLVLTLFPQQLKAQVITEIGESEICQGTIQNMSIAVQNLISIDSFRLVLEYDADVLEYVEYFGLNAALNADDFEVAVFTDSLVISWVSTGTASIALDTLVWLNFEGLTGTTNLHWNAGSSYYHTSGGNAFAIFNDGNAIVNPKIEVLITEMNSTCLNSCDANYMVNATGGSSPYTIRWNGVPGRFDSIQTGLCADKNLLVITDTKGCRLDSLFIIEGLPGPEVKLIIEGNDDTAIYLQNPVLKFSFEEVYPTHIIEPPLWYFGDGDTARSFNPTHLYDQAITNTDGYYEMKLIVKNDNGCESELVTRLFIKEADLRIPGVITPNGDSFNEAFLILNEEKDGSAEDRKITTEFQRMELIIFDRWGRKIYDDSNYQSDWRAEGVPDGAYYYWLKTVGFYKTEVKKGAITVLGGGIKN